jgi:hypothetical protein
MGPGVRGPGGGNLRCPTSQSFRSIDWHRGSVSEGKTETHGSTEFLFRSARTLVESGNGIGLNVVPDFFRAIRPLN